MSAEKPNDETQSIQYGFESDFDDRRNPEGQASRGEDDHIGPYRLLRRLGDGGMGTVYLAEQQKPIRREVALKVIKLGMDTRRVIARFEAERQALAVMDHPHIARILDAGATERGRPYFVMEHVRGVRITTFCDQYRLDVRERLRLFVQVCEAVQHAHQKGIIHRDIKPSNILVAKSDGKNVPKVIDFGIAKATAEPLTEQSLHTEPGQLVGTPAYMSPEQAEGATSDIDTRTDIYSLGVLLYELLVGVPLLDPQTVRVLSTTEIALLVREKEPLRPSTRVASLGEGAQAAAACRRCDIKTLAKSLRGDLDWIVLRAVEKDRSRRYQTVAALADDIQRYLDFEPVLAVPPGRVYRLKKFIRRYRGAVAAAALVFLTLTAGLTTSLVLYSRAEAQRVLANTKAETARQVKEMMINLFNVSDPSEGQGITAREILDRGVRSVQEDLHAQPEIQGALLSTMGRVYNQLGLYDVGRPLLKKAIDLQRTVAAAPDEELAASLYNLGGVLSELGDYDEAQRSLEESLAIRKKLYGEWNVEIADTIELLGTLYHQKGELERAVEAHGQAIEMYRKADTPDSLGLPIALIGLAAVDQDLGRLDDARPLYEQALEMHRRLRGADHLDVALDLQHLGTLAQAQNNIPDAERYYREAIDTYRRVLPSDHALLASAYNTYGALLHDKKDYSAAIDMYQQALAMHRRLFGDEHPMVASDMTGLAAVFRDQGQLEQAEGMLRDALAMRRKLLGDDNPYVGVTLTSLGVCLTKMKRFEEAEKALLEAHRIVSAAVEATSPRLIRVRTELATLYDEWAKPEEAAKYRALLASPSDN